MASIVLTGRVVNSTNISEGVPFTNVKITPNPGTVGFATDVDGHIFTSVNLNNDETYNFEFTSVGYSPQTIQKTTTTNSINFGVIKLVESNTVLDEFEVVAEKTIKDFSIKGTIVDNNKKPLSGALIESSKGETTRSQVMPKGKFDLKGQYDTRNQFTLTISLKDYNTISDIVPFTLDNNIIEDLGVYSLTPIEKDIEKELNQLSDFNEKQLSLLKNLPDKDAISLIISRLTSTLKKLLWPAILTLLAAYGITEINKLLKKKDLSFIDLKAVCPADIKALNKTIELKNKFTKQLSNLLKGISSIGKILSLPPEILEKFEKVINVAKIVVKVLPYIPSTAVTPIPVGPFLDAKDLIKALQDLIKSLKSKLGSNLFQLEFLIEDLNKALALLSILDMAILGCTKEISGNFEENITTQETISNDLLKATQEQILQGNPVITNINGFEMDVVSVKDNTDNQLKRRQAIAKNKAGVVLLKGEPSFSSNDQILIDELVFYIQQNDLKAD